MNTIPTYIWVKVTNSAGDANYIRYDGPPATAQSDNRYVKPTLVKSNYHASAGPVPASLRHLIVDAPE